MGKPPKSVRKYAQKHLKSAIARRRKLQPMKTAIRKKEAAQEDKRRKASRAQEAGISKNKKLEDMNVDELMAGDFLDGENDDGEEVSDADEASDSDDSLPKEDDDGDFVDITPEGVGDEESESDDEAEGTEIRAENNGFKRDIEKHKKQLESLKAKDPEFYEYLKEHDKELLDFGADEEDKEDEDDGSGGREPDEEEQPEKAVLTSALVEHWCNSVKEKQDRRSVRNLLSAYRSACHYGEGEGEDLGQQFNIKSSNVFNKVMVFVLSEMDGVFKKMLKFPAGKNVNPQDLQKNGRWKHILPYVKSYLGNSLHILNEMTDNRMLAFALRRLRPSIVFLADLPVLVRKYVKAVLHFWGTGEEALPFIAFTFLRDMVLQLGTDFLDLCSKGMYKQYVANTKFINASSLPRAQFLANCVVELYGIDTSLSYQNAFVFIRQMAIKLRSALTMKSKDAFREVYCWKFVAALELWVKVVSAYKSKDALGPLVYPLTQMISGVAALVPTARYFPLRLQCVIMLNKLAAATGAFIPVVPLLFDMLEFSELRRPPTGGAGRATDFQLVLKVSKQTVKTRAFQEECVTSVLERLTEHLAQWSCAIAFPELAVVPLDRLRRFMKQTKVDRFRRQAKQLLDQIKRNVEFVSRKRDVVTFSPSDTDEVAAFLKGEKEAGSSPLAQYYASLKQRAQEQKEALIKSSVEVKEQVDPVHSERIDDAGAEKLFNKTWFEEKKSKAAEEKERTTDEDVVEDLMLSSDEEEEEQDEQEAVQGSSDDDEPQNDGEEEQQRRRRRPAQPPVKRKHKKRRRN